MTPILEALEQRNACNVALFNPATSAVLPLPLLPTHPLTHTVLQESAEQQFLLDADGSYQVDVQYGNSEFVFAPVPAGDDAILLETEQTQQNVQQSALDASDLFFSDVFDDGLLWSLDPLMPSLIWSFLRHDS